MDTFPDLGSLSDQELKDLIQQLTEEEIDISYKRRILHGKIDILRAELVNRLRKKHEGGEDVITGADVQRLTDILAGRAAGDDAEEPARRRSEPARGAPLPRVRLRQRRGRQLLPACGAFLGQRPRRAGRADHGDLPHRRDRRARSRSSSTTSSPRGRRAGHPRRRRARGRELPARRRAHDDRPPARLRHLPRRRDRLARPRAARAPRRRLLPRRPRLAQRHLRQPLADRVAPRSRTATSCRSASTS